MSKMRKVALALVGAAALSVATGAGATTPINLDGYNVDFATLNATDDGINFLDITTAGMFTDTLQFTNSIAGMFDLHVSTIGPANFLDQLSCAGCGITISGPNGSQSFGAGVATLVGYDFELKDLNLGVGQYTLSLTGNSPSGGMLNGLVSFTAVPEPAAWAMMLIGFGVIGASIRRRRTRVAVRQLA